MPRGEASAQRRCGGARNEETGHYVIEINPQIVALYGRDGWTQVEWEQRRALKGQPLAQWLHSLADAAGVISKATEIEFVEAGSQAGKANPYQSMAEFCNREMSKAVLGQTLTTDTTGATGTYAAAQVHGQVRRDLVEADAQALATTLREQLLRPLVGFNFGWDRPVPWFRFKYEEEEDLKTLSEVYRNLGALGVPLSPEHLAERFGIPLT